LLGVEVIPTPAGLFLFLSQHKEIRELLERTQMTGDKEVSTPLPTLWQLPMSGPTSIVEDYPWT
jgi:hypothetical protein